MTWLALAACVALMLFGATSLLASLLVWPALGRHLAGAEPRGETLLALRFAPTLAAAFVSGAIFLPVFLRLEPRQSGERVGVVMLAVAASVAAMLLAGPLRALRSIVATHSLERRWRAGPAPVALPGWRLPAFAIDERFPLIAVVGVLRPRLYIARQVLARCTRDEIAAIVAHEAGHVARRDNFARLLLRSCPDPLAFTPMGDAVERAWSEACDRAADDHAAARTGSRLDLAAALVTVARALGAPAPAGRALAAHCQEGEITSRVRRLLRPGPGRDGRGAAPRRVARLVMPALVLTPACAAIAAATLSPTVAGRIQALAESAVRLLQ